MIRITLETRTRQELNSEITYASFIGDLRYQKRLQFALILPDGIEMEKLSMIFQKTVRCLYQWRTLFLTKSVTGLRYKKNKGKKKLLSKYQRKKLKKMIIEGPEKQGFECALWKSAMIQELIFQKFGVEYSLGYIPQLLKELGFSHKRIERISHKADKDEQQKWEEKTFPELIEKSIKEGAVIMYQDESTALMWSQSGYSWGLIGKRLETVINMGNKTRKIFGAIELLTGKFHYQAYKGRMSKSIFQDYCNYVSKKYEKIFMVIDNGPIHRIGDSYKNIEFFRLPTYSPILNPIEKLWKKLKCDSLHGRYFRGEKDFENKLIIGLEKIKNSPGEILKLMDKWVSIYDEVYQRHLRWKHVYSLFDKALS